MNSDQVVPPGDDPLYAEFIALWVSSTTQEQKRFIFEMIEDEMKRKTHIIVTIFTAIIAVLIVVADVMGQDGFRTGLLILLGIEIGLFVGILIKDVMRGK